MMGKRKLTGTLFDVGNVFAFRPKPGTFHAQLAEAQRAGLLKGAALTLAIDTKPIIGRGAVLDTYNLLGSGIQKLGTALAVAQGREPEGWAGEHALSRYFSGRESSLKGSTEID